MDLSQIISIAGKPGLYKIINQSRGGVVVTSLIDGKKMAIGQTQRVSSLSDISIYTQEGDEPLADIFKKFSEFGEGKELDLDLNDKDLLRDFFKEMLPDHDEERVYPSDIKKMIKWYNSMVSKGLLDFSDSADQTEAKSETEDAEDADSETSESEEAK